MFTDFHNHSLPDIDDGAATIQESCDMLESLSNQGVKRVVLTPHFHKDQNLSLFLQKRKSLYAHLRKTISPKIKLQLASEVALDKNISKEVELSKLTVKKSKYLMIKLPYFSFEDWIDQELHNILYKHDLIPIFTSIDRYAITYPKEKYEKILNTPYAVFQFNVKAFTNPNNVKMVKDLISKGKTVLIGSNAHNTSTRKPNFDLLEDSLKAALGSPVYNYLIMQNNRFLLPIKRSAITSSWTDISS